MSVRGTAVRYVPGNAVLLQHGQRAVILRLVADHGLVGETWSRLEQGASIDQLLELILGEGLRTVSEFALLERSSGSLRMILRGGIGAEVRRDSGTESIETQGIWVDRRLEGEGVLALTTDGGETSGQQLPLEGGIVLAGGVLVPLTEHSQHDETGEIGAPVEATDARAESLAARESARQDPVVSAAPVSVHSSAVAEPVPAHAAAAEREIEPESVEQGDPAAQPEFVDVPADEPGPSADEGPAAAYASDDASVPEPAPVHGDGGFGAAAPAAAVGTGVTPPPPPAGLTGQATEVFEPEQPAAPSYNAPADPYATAPYQVGQDDDEVGPTQVTPSVYHGPVMLLPDGQEIELSQPTIIGRGPRRPDDYEGVEPRLVALHDPDRDVSSTHLQVEFDGTRVMVTDLGSTNGTDLCEPGQQVRLLQAGEPTELRPGSHLLLAGSQKVTFEAR